MYTTIVLSFFGFTQVSLRIPGKAVSVVIKNPKVICGILGMTGCMNDVEILHYKKY